MFRKKIYACVETVGSRLWYKSSRPFFKHSHSYPTNGQTFPFTQTLVVSAAAAFGITLYIVHKNKISCEIDLNPRKVIEIIDEDDPYDKAIRKSRDIVQRVKDEYGIPGLVVGVSIDGRTVWKEGFGYADVENRVMCSSDTVMRIASISKSITMAAVAKLWEQGKLDVDKPVQEYVPSFPQKFYGGKP
ncbi:Serine beta-lactamase-like protein LACTB, mitochondrial, partial [Araneus ventricosus]